MGPVSLLLRAPFDRLAGNADIRVVYLLTSLPCIVAFAFAVRWLKRLVEQRQTPAVALMIAVLVGLNTAAIRTIHWGHPEDLLTVALLLSAALAATRLHWSVTAVLMGLALASKQWALLAFLPIALSLPAKRVQFIAVAVLLAGLITLPFALEAPSRFKDIALATTNTEAFWHKNDADGKVSHVTPANAIWPFAERRYEYRAGLWVHSAVVSNPVVRVTHILVGLLVLPLSLLGWRARRRAGPEHWLLVLATIFLFRNILDPVNFDYYQLAGLAFLGAWEGLARPGFPALTTLAAAGVAITWAAHERTFAALYQHSLWMNVTYLLWMLPLLFLLLRRQLSLSRS